jgi:hypothetical protein
MKQDPIGQYNDEVADMFSELPPFNIIVNNGHDAGWISSAMMLYLCAGDNDKADKGLKLMILMAKKHGVEAGVTKFFEQSNADNIRFPAFIKPVFVHMVGYALEKYKKQEDGL